MEPRHSYQFKGERRSPDKLAGLIVCRQVLLPCISMRAADSTAAGKVVTEGTKKELLGGNGPTPKTENVCFVNEPQRRKDEMIIQILLSMEGEAMENPH